MALLQSILYKNTLCRQIFCKKLKGVITVPTANSFWEPDRKGGYGTKIKRRPSKVIKQVLQEFPQESQKFMQETKEKIQGVNLMYRQHGDYEIFYKFNDKDSINKWVVTVDSDHHQGKSKAEFILGPNKKGIFKGILNNEIPEDGITKNAGYANIKAPHAMKSFYRPEPLDWSMYTHLILMCRGDGRSYQLLLKMERYFDVQWNDIYSYTLFTHGGPYWQYVKIPFSRFFLNSKGRIQDKQTKVDLEAVSWLGITLGDSINGPFQLELDWIGCVADKNHDEDFAYEMYQVKPHVVS